MTKYLIMSDTHGDKELVQEVLNYYKGKVDMIFHCGDSELEPNDKALLGINIVKGNCDYFNFDNELIVDHNHIRFFITHGHLYNVNFDLLQLKYKAQEVGADIVLFGHTHIPTIEMDENTLIINPGSLLQPRIYPSIPTYAILEITETQYIINYYNNKHELQNSFSKVIDK